MEEQVIDQEQTEIEDAQGEQTPQPSALEERLGKLERDGEETKKYVTKLEQENATYRTILTDRGAEPRRDQAPKQPTVSKIDAEIAELRRRAEEGEISAEELSLKSLELIGKAKDAGKEEAIKEITGMYTQEQEVNRAYASIFQDADLKGLDKDLGDMAYGYMLAGINQGKSPEQAAQYAKEQTKIKVDTFKKRFGGTTKEAAKVVGDGDSKVQEHTEKASGFRSEGESVKQPKTKEEPVTAESAQKSFIEMRRSKLS